LSSEEEEKKLNPLEVVSPDDEDVDEDGVRLAIPIAPMRRTTKSQVPPLFLAMLRAVPTPAVGHHPT
jgi:hypothetical protein